MVGSITTESPERERFLPRTEVFELRSGGESPYVHALALGLTSAGKEE